MSDIIKDESKPATVAQVKEIVYDAVRQLIEFMGVQYTHLDTKIDSVRDEMKQDLYETKVELRNEIRSSQKEFDHRITRLETGL